MLKKLIKYEWKGTASILFPLHLSLIIITVIGFIFLNLGLLQTPDKSVISNYLLVIYVFAIVALSIATYIVLIMRFYKNLFTGEGYLMFTLPVTPAQLLFSKTIVALLWAILNFIIMFGSIFVLLISIFPLKEMQIIYEMLMSFADTYVIGGRIGTILFLVFGFIIGLFKTFLTIYVSIAIGNLITKHKIAGFFLVYIILMTIEQGCSLFILFIIGIVTSQIAVTDMFSYLNWTFIFTLLLNLFMGCIYFIATHHIVSKKLNLE